MTTILKYIKKKTITKVFEVSHRDYKISTQARHLLQESKLEEALEQLLNVKIKVVRDEVTLISQRLKHLQKEERLGIIDESTKTIKFNQIAHSIIGVINNIEKKFRYKRVVSQKITDGLKYKYLSLLNQKLVDRQPIKLNCLYSKTGTSEIRSKSFVPVSSEELSGSIHSIFEKAHGRLLILGSPGAGKTCLLLQLALALIESDDLTIPVIVSLSTWREKFFVLENWLKEMLPQELGVNKFLAKKIVEEGNLILLLDGFDELKEDSKESAMLAIGRYAAVSKHRFAITSRTSEYSLDSWDAPVHLQIELEPLTYQQLDSDLKRIGYSQPEAQILWQTVRSNPSIIEIIQVPFYYNLLQIYLAQGRSVTNLQFDLEDNDKIKQEILQIFIREQILVSVRKKQQVATYYNYLAFLAYQMEHKNIQTFELSNLQFDWWRKWSSYEIYFGKLLAFLVIAIKVAILFFLGGFFMPIFIVFKEGVTVALSKGIDIGVGSGCIIFLIMTLLGILASFLDFGEYDVLIEVKEQKKFAWKPFIVPLAPSILSGIVLGLLVMPWQFIEDGNGIIMSFAYSTLYGLALGGGVGLFFSLVYGIYKNLTQDYEAFIISRSPYHKFISSISSLHFSIFQHWFLRFRMYRNKLLPFRLVHFLNSMSEQHILESVQGVWRFRHRKIQEYFTQFWNEKEDI